MKHILPLGPARPGGPGRPGFPIPGDPGGPRNPLTNSSNWSERSCEMHFNKTCHYSLAYLECIAQALPHKLLRFSVTCHTCCESVKHVIFC